jgi:hypothetical protein
MGVGRWLTSRHYRAESVGMDTFTQCGASFSGDNVKFYTH